MKKQTGIWLDKEKAHIVFLENGLEKMQTITSGVENYNVKGGSRSKTKWGPQDVVQDSKYLEREKHQLKKYFHEIANTVRDADAIVIFGPAETNNKLHKELQSNYAVLAEKVTSVEKIGKLTENQLKALIRNYYK